MISDYFLPVKDIVSDETKEYMQKKFWSHEHSHVENDMVLSLQELKRHWKKPETIPSLYERKKYADMGVSLDFIRGQLDIILDAAKRWDRRSGGKLRGDLVGIFIESNNLNIPKETLLELLDNFEQKYVINDGYVTNQNEGEDGKVWGRFHTDQANPPLFENAEPLFEVTEKYGGDNFCFLHTSGARTTIAKHIDPLRQAAITFPLEPELKIYRNLNYYDSFDDTDPVHIVDYNAINTCVLLNNQKIHSIEDNDPTLSGKSTLCFQVSYFTKTYDEVKSMLRDKGLLNA